MKLIDIYNFKLRKYNKTGIKEEPNKLLALLLLSEKSKFKYNHESLLRFQQIYEKEINEKISKIENDFNFTKEEIIEIIKKEEQFINYDVQKIWVAYVQGFRVLQYALFYHQGETPEQIYEEYFGKEDMQELCEELKKINESDLEDVLNKVLPNSREFYQRVCEYLTIDERMYIKDNLENRSCDNCLNGSCCVETCEKIGLDEFGHPQGYNCAGWYNAELIGKSKVLKRTDVK